MPRKNGIPLGRPRAGSNNPLDTSIHSTGSSQNSGTKAGGHPHAFRNGQGSGKKHLASDGLLTEGIRSKHRQHEKSSSSASKPLLHRVQSPTPKLLAASGDNPQISTPPASQQLASATV